MSSLKFGTCLGLLLVASAGVTTAQVTINSVVNAASLIPSSAPSYGIAQGALFAIIGKGLGPDQLQQASFPLPTTDGLAGVSVQATVSGTTVDCIMVYVSASEVGAILPSSTPSAPEPSRSTTTASRRPSHSPWWPPPLEFFATAQRVSPVRRWHSTSLRTTEARLPTALLKASSPDRT